MMRKLAIFTTYLASGGVFLLGVALLCAMYHSGKDPVTWMTSPSGDIAMLSGTWGRVVGFLALPLGIGSFAIAARMPNNKSEERRAFLRAGIVGSAAGILALYLHITGIA